MVTIHDFGITADGMQYLAMELVDGESLDSRLKRLGRLTADEAVPLLLAVARCLATAHSADVIHRDVKPANIMVSQSGQVKLVDFGLARRCTECEDGLTAQGIVVGTPGFLPPELVLSGKTDDPRGDVYAVRVTAQLVDTETATRCRCGRGGTHDGAGDLVLHVEESTRALGPTSAVDVPNEARLLAQITQLGLKHRCLPLPHHGRLSRLLPLRGRRRQTPVRSCARRLRRPQDRQAELGVKRRPERRSPALRAAASTFVRRGRPGVDAHGDARGSAHGDDPGGPDRADAVPHLVDGGGQRHGGDHHPTEGDERDDDTHP